jgi:hypothetical protein
MSKEFVRSLAESIVRVDKLIWIPGLASCFSDDFRELVENDIGGSRDIFERIPWIETFSGDPDDIVVELIIRGLTGFFAHLSAPIPTAFPYEGSIEYSWGYYRSRWVYADSLDEIAALAKTFRDKTNELARDRLEANLQRGPEGVV